MTSMERGTLWHTMLLATERARAAGALLPVPTDQASIEEGGVRYLVRVQAGLRRKDDARRAQDAAVAAGRGSNPFLPPEQDLIVGEISGTHLAVLNKFNVVEHHLLLVTRRFEEQELLLTPEDFEALCACMAEYASLGFYNGGPEGGASQEHKHLQIVPLPLDPEGPAVPVEPLLRRAPRDRDGIGMVPDFPFLHAMARLEPGLGKDPAEAAARSYQCYRSLLQRVGMGAPEPGRPVRQSLPYCLLVTREWMLLVPRGRERFEGISLNALAYAGSFFVRDEAQLQALRRAGPMRALASVALPR